MSDDSSLEDAIDRLREVGDGGVEFARLYEHHARAILRALERSAPACVALRPASVAWTWTFPREWHVEADRVVTGGLRESGPA